MRNRVLLIVVGLMIAFGLSEFFGVPGRWAVAIGLIPFGLLEARNLGPYEKSARDELYGDSDKRS